MKFYTCCPHEGCGGFQSALSFLHSWGIEPEIAVDDTGHYFAFELPTDWPESKRRKFCWLFTQKTSGVRCKCGQWLNEDCEGKVLEVKCKRCGAISEWCLSCIKPKDIYCDKCEGKRNEGHRL